MLCLGTAGSTTRQSCVKSCGVLQRRASHAAPPPVLQNRLASHAAPPTALQRRPSCVAPPTALQRLTSHAAAPALLHSQYRVLLHCQCLESLPSPGCYCLASAMCSGAQAHLFARRRTHRRCRHRHAQQSRQEKARADRHIRLKTDLRLVLDSRVEQLELQVDCHPIADWIGGGAVYDVHLSAQRRGEEAYAVAPCVRGNDWRRDCLGYAAHARLASKWAQGGRPRRPRSR